MSGEANVKGYAPLPQSISNTDTDEDEDEEQLNQADSCTSKEDDQSRTSDATVICQNGRFYPLDETKNLSNRSSRNGRSSFGYSTDNIPIMILSRQNNDDLWKRHDMSPLRRFFLVISVLLCIVTILVFLYVLPCETSSLCPPALGPRVPISWDQTFEGIELHGKISVIPGRPYDLIFLLKGQQFGHVVTNLSGKQQINPKGGGILSLQGTNGSPLWWVALKKLPVNINCELFDSNKSGKPNCIVSGEDGLLVSIEPSTGRIIWNAELHTSEEIPLQLSDLNSDGINDLLSVSISNTSQDLVFISGKKGKLLSKYRLPSIGCHMIKLNNIDSSFVLSYSCYNDYFDQITRNISLQNFIKLHNFSQVHQKSSWGSYFFQTSDSSKPYPNQTSKDSWDLTPHHRLYVRNAGGELCPSDNCSAKVNLTLRRGRNESRIWDHASDSSFVTRPAILDSSGRAFTTGFVLKFWNWTNDLKKTVTSNILEGVRPCNLTERVSIVFVNNTIVRIMNASQSEVLQLCQGQNCQPSLPRQAKSILIADLNNDGVAELISYRSTYTVAENDTKPVLTSKVQVVKLDDLLDEHKLNWLFENAVL